MYRMKMKEIGIVSFLKPDPCSLTAQLKTED